MNVMLRCKISHVRLLREYSGKMVNIAYKKSQSRSSPIMIPIVFISIVSISPIFIPVVPIILVHVVIFVPVIIVHVSIMIFFPFSFNVLNFLFPSIPFLPIILIFPIIQVRPFEIMMMIGFG